MCAPLLAVAALTIASTAYGVYKTNQNAKNQERALKSSSAVQEKQIYDQRSAQANDRYHQAQQERARLRAASAESGVAGLSVDSILNNVDLHAGLDVNGIQHQEQNDIQAEQTTYQSRLNSIQQPDYLAAGLQIGRSVANAYSGGAAGGYTPPSS